MCLSTKLCGDIIFLFPQDIGRENYGAIDRFFYLADNFEPFATSYNPLLPPTFGIQINKMISFEIVIKKHLPMVQKIWF